MVNVSFEEICNISSALDPSLDVNSVAFETLCVYVAMNWTRGYSSLRKILPFNKSLIERCRQRFIYGGIRPGWLTKILTENWNNPEIVLVEVALISLYAEGNIVKITQGRKIQWMQKN